MIKKLLISIPYPRMLRMFFSTYVLRDIFDYCKSSGIEVFIIKPEDLNFEIDNNVFKVINYPMEFSIPNNKFSTLVNVFINPVLAWRNSFRDFIYGRFFFSAKGIKKIIYKTMTMIGVFFWNISSKFRKKVHDCYRDLKIHNLLKENKIDAVIATCPCLLNERILCQSCEDLNIPVVACSDGWDIFTGFSYLNKFKCYLSWGPAMTQHIKLLDLENPKVVQCGIPYLPDLKSCYDRLDKKEILKKYRLSENDKIVLFFGGNWFYYGECEKVAFETILNLIKNDPIFKDYKIIRRRRTTTSDPGESDIFYSQYENDEHVRFSDVSSFFQEYTSDIHKFSYEEIAELFKISSVHINCFSMSLLEASLCDVPCIMNVLEDCFYPCLNIINADNNVSFTDLVKCGIPVLRKRGDLRKMLIDICENKSYNQNVKEIWSCKDNDYVKKMFDILEN